MGMINSSVFIVSSRLFSWTYCLDYIAGALGRDSLHFSIGSTSLRVIDPLATASTCSEIRTTRRSGIILVFIKPSFFLQKS